MPTASHTHGNSGSGRVLTECGHKTNNKSHGNGVAVASGGSFARAFPAHTSSADCILKYKYNNQHSSKGGVRDRATRSRGVTEGHPRSVHFTIHIRLYERKPGRAYLDLSQIQESMGTRLLGKLPGVELGRIAEMA